MARPPSPRSTWPGPIGAIVLDEFGDDAPLLLGDNAGTVALLSAALLQTPSGETGLRRLLRHFRALLGKTPSYVYGLEARVVEADERAAAAVRTCAAAEARVDAEVKARADHEARCQTALAALSTELEQTRHALARERALRASEHDRLCAEVSREAAGASTVAYDGACKLSLVKDSWRQDVERKQAELGAAQDQLERGAMERANMAAELRLAWQALADKDGQLRLFALALREAEEGRKQAVENAERAFIDSCVGRSLDSRRRDAALGPLGR